MSTKKAARLFSAVVLVSSLILILAPAWNVLAQESRSDGKTRKQAVKKDVIVWDTGRSYNRQGREFAALPHKSRWARVPINVSTDYTFNGDCVLENEHLWLYLPAKKNNATLLSSTIRSGSSRGIALYEYDQEARRCSGPKSIRILTNAGDEAAVVYGTTARQDSMVKVGYRLASGKHWIQTTPLENAGRVGIAIKSQLVIAPNEFGEDFICDSLKHKPGSTVPLPQDNLVIALNCDGNFVSVITYPSIAQAGDILIGSSEAVNNHGQRVLPSITTVNARFKGKSIFIGLLPYQDNWHYERINKVYSSSGQYVSDWKPSYPGLWRLVGRVRGRYRVNDASGDHFIFACSWSGTFEYLFAYMYARTKNTAADVVTPMDIYRETLGVGPHAYLLDTEGLEDVHTGIRKTKHRDVCGTLNDLKETWKDQLDRIEKDRDYVSNLTEDAKTIMGRMESRLNEYRRMTGAVAAVCARMKGTQGSREYAEFAGVVRNCHEKLANVKATRYDYGCRTADEIARISREEPERLKSDQEHVNKLAEEVRAVAQSQENKMKEYRNIAARLSGLCEQQRKAKQEELKQWVTVVGRLCRRVLRNRDPEE